MTREEAIEFSYTQGNGDDSTVHEIYDDFESRTCSNCKFYTSTPARKCSTIDDRYTEHYCGNFMPPAYFGCNQFKRKTQ